MNLSRLPERFCLNMTENSYSVFSSWITVYGLSIRRTCSQEQSLLTKLWKWTSTWLLSCCCSSQRSIPSQVRHLYTISLLLFLSLSRFEGQMISKRAEECTLGVSSRDFSIRVMHSLISGVKCTVLRTESKVQQLLFVIVFRRRDFHEKDMSLLVHPIWGIRANCLCALISRNPMWSNSVSHIQEYEAPLAILQQGLKHGGDAVNQS